MKKLLGLVAALAVLCGFWLFRVGPEVTVILPPGLPAGETARILEQEGVIASPLAFRLIAKLTGFDRRLKPGSYRLRRLMSSPEAIWRLTRGRAELVRVVIPEGFSVRQIAERLGASKVTSAAEFESYARSARLEGYLFPTTYFMSVGMEAAAVAQLMRQEFKRLVEPEFQGTQQPRLSLEQVVILASIVEREAVLADEKPAIAAVYLNRLAKRMRLEADPTVQYAVGHWKKRLTRSDLQNASPYNTYVQFGLPPGPICSPGLASIQAVLAPAKTAALYFVADNNGGHTFNATYEAHLKAVLESRKELRRRGLR